MSLDGYERYGKRFLESSRNLPCLTVYSEDDLPIPHKKLDDPVHLAFLERCPPDPLDYRFQARRFSYKTFAVLAASHSRGRMIWLDADVNVFAKVPEAFLDGLLPKGAYTAYLGRPNMHSECGFVIYDRDHKAHDWFMRSWRRLYETDALFQLPEWHDSFVYDHLRTALNVPAVNISGKAADHPFINSPLGKYMDHLKGNRKQAGRSRPQDLVWRRKEGYWNAV